MVLNTWTVALPTQGERPEKKGAVMTVFMVLHYHYECLWP